MSPAQSQAVTSEEEMTVGPAAGWAVALLIFFLFWVISGIAAFFMSILCFAYSGTVLEKIGGFAIAVIFGPFYWIYYAFMKTYCASNPVPQSKGGRSSRK